MESNQTIILQLREDHDELQKSVNRFRTLLAEAVPPSGIDLVSFRQKFSRQILVHHYREDLMLYPRLLNSKCAAVSTMARAMFNEMGGLLDDYKKWAVCWPTARVQADWKGFRQEATELLDALTRRIDRENNVLYPLLERGFEEISPEKVEQKDRSHSLTPL